ncbi:chitinase [Histoplasma capsulatum G186AR]|uniref:Chitinase n=2 Tax=Ajellomyces capsulatus TaxID=5037 RepID=C0NWX2_AJECG|nr:chitinase [Histoplasma capsulatum G186AR]EEH03838.1 chitinase [Histoplasma capsulatum G186AR]KAG5295444.1 chitinase [Histoplasma capsulatum]QSS73425.1 chitinase [Histoplasma capsulatum G186AR]
MKVVTLLAAGAFTGLGMAQDLQGVSECARGCIGRMLDLAPSLGCKADDVACLCKNMDFAYGVRDCTTEACGAQDLPAAAAAAARYCPGNAPSGSQEPRATATSKQTASPTGAPRPSEASSMGLGSSASTPYTTQAIVSTITSGTQVITTTVGSTTLYSPVSATTGTAGTTGTQPQSTGSGSSPTDKPSSTGNSETTSSGESTGTGTGTTPTPTGNGASHSLIPATLGIMGAVGIALIFAW